jgi:hypothetical protein
LAVILASIDPKFQISTKSGAFGSSNTVVLEITNWDEVMKVIRELDEDWIRGLRKEFRAIGAQAQKKVKDVIPGKNKPPLSGMRQVHFGRLAWGTTYGGDGPRPRPAKSVLIQTPNTRKKKYRELERVPIVRLQIGSPATVLLDMGGRRFGAKGRKGLTPEYDYMYTIGGRKVPGKRQHRVRPGAFAKGFGTGGARVAGKVSASRFVYPAVEKSMPSVTRRMREVVFRTNSEIQAKLARQS